MQKETYPTAISIGKTKNGASGETEAMAEGQEKKTDAEREQLEEAFRQKISRELEEFKEGALRMGKEEIFSIAYRIDCMIRIYEMLAEHSGEFEEEELKRCIQEEGLLQSLYQRWLKSPAPQEGELEHSVWSGIKEICRDAGGEALKAEGRTEEKKQKFLEAKEGTGKEKQKFVEIKKKRKNQIKQGIKTKQEAQMKQEIQIKQEKNGAQRKERFYGKADSDQKPAA